MPFALALPKCVDMPYLRHICPMRKICDYCRFINFVSLYHYFSLPKYYLDLYKANTVYSECLFEQLHFFMVLKKYFFGAVVYRHIQSDFLNIVSAVAARVDTF